MSTVPAGRSWPRRLLVTAAKLAVSGSLLALLLSRVDLAELGDSARQASPGWLVAAVAIYAASFPLAMWRWRLLLGAQGVSLSARTLLASYLVATFFNNFLPSNIGGDVVRIRDTAPFTGSKTLATTIVLIDRVVGVMALVFIAATGATLAARAGQASASPIWPSWLWAGFLLAVAVAVPTVAVPAGVGRLLRPLTVLHPEWVGDRIEKLTAALARFRERPSTLAACFSGALVVQAMLIAFYLSVARALHIPIGAADMAVVVPLSFVVQLVPVSVNGFGVREAAFSVYFTRLQLPIHSAVLLSLTATGLMMAFSLTGAVVYVARQRSH